jgi:lysophospholipase L1-like esterase
VVVSTFLDQLTPFATISVQDLRTSWVVAGNSVLKPKLEAATPMAINHIVTGLDVWGREPALTVVAFGDSITAGGGEAGEGAYPDLLATRLRDSPPGAQGGVGAQRGHRRQPVAARRLGPSGLSRFARDALGQSGVTHVIVLLGTNDIGRKALVSKAGLVMPPGEMPTAQRITAGLAQLIAQARAKGVKVLIGTVPPFKNGVYWDKDTEAMRDEVNRWIRGAPGRGWRGRFRRGPAQPHGPASHGPEVRQRRPPASGQGRPRRDGRGGRRARVG